MCVQSLIPLEHIVSVTQSPYLQKYKSTFTSDVHMPITACMNIGLAHHICSVLIFCLVYSTSVAKFTRTSLILTMSWFVLVSDLKLTSACSED